VCDDVIERFLRVRKLQQVKMAQFQILDPQFFGEGLSFLDGREREIESEKVTLRQVPCHGQEICTVATTDLQHAAFLRSHRVQSMQASQDVEVLRVGVLVGIARVADLIVISHNRKLPR
jgi:hypothetical protein